MTKEPLPENGGKQSRKTSRNKKDQQERLAHEARKVKRERQLRLEQQDHREMLDPDIFLDE